MSSGSLGRRKGSQVGAKGNPRSFPQPSHEGRGGKNPELSRRGTKGKRISLGLQMQNEQCSGLKPPEEGKGDYVCVYQLEQLSLVSTTNGSSKR